MSEPTLLDEALNELRFCVAYLSAQECNCHSRDGKDHAPRCASWSVLRGPREVLAKAATKGTIGARPETSTSTQSTR